MKKSLFADLGRPTLRGIRKCPKCGTINGTRGSSCKNKDCGLVFTKTKDNKQTVLEASQLTSLPGFQEVYYSVRCKEGRKEEKDQRIFVKRTQPSSEDKRETYHCFAQGCNKGGDQHVPCLHITAAQKCSSRSLLLHLKKNVLSTLLVPKNFGEVIGRLLGSSKLVVQRVSKVGFVVASQKDEKVEWDHCLFTRHPSVEWKFCCSCSGKQDGEEGNGSETKGTMCLHYYICTFAFACDDNLKREFELIIHRRRHPSVSQSPLLSQAHVSESDATVKLTEVDSEMMRDNLSLLEMSVPGGDENVQTLEEVLTDPIIVTSVEDPLAFADGTVLDTLDEDHTVCQIFPNSQGTIHLNYTQTHNGRSRNKRNSETFRSSVTTKEDKGASNSGAPPPKKQKESKKESQLSNPSRTRSEPFKAPRLTLAGRDAIADDPQIYWSFDSWLGGVNDMINSTMNFQLPPNPSAQKYYIPSVYFDFLRERLMTCSSSITTHKKRLPNNTCVVQRSDKPPIGSFTKHVWKITSIMQLLKVFESSSVRLKPKQFFTLSSNGNFVEWVPPLRESDDSTPKPRILPVLHCTMLKCGRNYPSNAKKATPFVIEWIPEILRASKLGELTIQFQLHKVEPSAAPRTAAGH